MSEMEDKLGAILGNPQMMQQIMSMAKAMNAQPSAPQSHNPMPEPPASDCEMPLDPQLLRTLSGFIQNNRVDQDQQTLLNALCPYLSQQRVSKLEKAMRAAKMARLASGFLNSGGLSLLTGR